MADEPTTPEKAIIEAVEQPVASLIKPTLGVIVEVL
jgi:hypothetical protein